MKMNKLRLSNLVVYIYLFLNFPKGEYIYIYKPQISNIL